MQHLGSSGLRKDRERMHGGVARRQSGHASPRRNRESIRRTVQERGGANRCHPGGQTGRDDVATVPKQATATGSKTAKDCIAEWRADKTGMQAGA
jgi:hypothetical protein